MKKISIFAFVFILGTIFTRVFPIYAADIIPLPPAGSMYYGAWVGGEEGINSEEARDNFISLTGKKLAIIPYVIGDQINFSNDLNNEKSQLSRLKTISETYSAIPLVTIQIKNRTLNEIISNKLHENDNRLNGRRKDLTKPESFDNLPDEFFESWAKGLADYGQPVFLRFAHEMSAEGAYPTHIWAACGDNCKDLDTGKPQTPDLYIQAWKHVHDIFEKAGATNVVWVWCPNRQENTVSDTIAGIWEFYPGDDYVDWIALDVYDRNKRRSFSTIFTPEYKALEKTTKTKPIMLAEFNSYLREEADKFGYKADWIKNTFKDIPKFPKIKAVVWFNVSVDESDFRIEKNKKMIDAYKKAVNSPFYLSNINIPTPTPSALCQPCPNSAKRSGGDANCDKTIDVFDFSLWQKEHFDGNMGAIVRNDWSADFNCDGLVDVHDYSLLQGKIL